MVESEVEEGVILAGEASESWVEKYRPSTLDEIVSHQDIINTIKRFLSQNRLPHLLFYGPPGTGKTTTIQAIARQIYGTKSLGSMVLELNASDDRGIGIVRNEILSFAGTRTIFSSRFKLVILDEADAMTQDAQNALRRIMEKYTENTRFCLICNYLSKIIPAIQSRCTRFRFGPLPNNLIMPRLEHLIQEEKINVTEDGKKALVDLAGGDMRKVLNVLQSASMAFKKVNEEAIYLCCGHPLRRDIQHILECLISGTYVECYKDIMEIKTKKGLALQDIITQIHLFVLKIDFPLKIKIGVLEKLADIELHLANGGTEKINVSALVAAFEPVRVYSRNQTKK